jgi:hypothetical protein
MPGRPASLGQQLMAPRHVSADAFGGEPVGHGRSKIMM